MLVHLSIRNYAIVEQLDLELQGGMTAITGETGAGKSIMLDALGLALGDRSDQGVVRIGAERADILATFDITGIDEAGQWLNERDLDSDGPCILRRVITREGRSRGYINGTPCTLADLKDLGERLIDIHSQHEHQSLLKPDTHRRLLDAYAGAGELARQVQQSAQRWRQVRHSLQQSSRHSEERRSRRQLLSYQLEELDNLALGDEELPQLERTQKTLLNGASLLDSCQRVIDLCCENEHGSVLQALRSSIQRLGSSPARPPALDEAMELLASAQIQVEEATAGLHRFIDHFDADPQRLQEIEQRLDSIYNLARKHRVQPAELGSLQERLREELAQLDADDAGLEGLEAQLTELAEHYREQASQLSRQRQLAAATLARAVEHEMQRLGMPGGRFAIAMQPLTSEEPHPQGAEQVEFHVSANPGQPLRSIAKVASGGELSRISLAIQVITAQTSRTPTLVFDEVDVGIGGPTAEVVGQLLRRLGAAGQVITVTHLPQVAAQGHQHLFVHKQRGSAETRTAVTRLDERQRIEEVARMLGGLDLTRESLAHARCMIHGAGRSAVAA